MSTKNLGWGRGSKSWKPDPAELARDSREFGGDWNEAHLFAWLWEFELVRLWGRSFVWYSHAYVTNYLVYEDAFVEELWGEAYDTVAAAREHLVRWWSGLAADLRARLLSGRPPAPNRGGEP